jgi:LysM repeat protein
MRPDEDKVKTKKKTYAEMAKEDKAKGKAKILALRAKDKKEVKKPGDKEKKAKGVSFFKNLAATLKNKGKASANEMKMAGPTKSASSVKVKSGSNLSTIAQKAGITLKQLLAANPKYAKNPNKINVGDTVKIPAVSKKKGSVYEGMSKSKMASMDMKNGGTPMKKKTKYMAKGGYGTPTKKMKMKAGGASMKKTKYMAKGGMKKTKYMAKGGAAKRK